MEVKYSGKNEVKNGKQIVPRVIYTLHVDLRVHHQSVTNI